MDPQGTWYNEFGSKLVIDPVVNGQVTGTYVTAIAASAWAKGTFTLVGRTDLDSGGDAIAFVVCWRNQDCNCESVTAWSGQAQTVDGVDQITAYWLLTVESAPDQDWYATHVGQDVFSRVQRAAGQPRPRRATRPSHP